MLECNGKRINKSDVDNGFNDAGKDKARTYTESSRANLRYSRWLLEDCRSIIKAIAEIALATKASDIFMVHFKLIDGDKNNTANPKARLVKRRNA